MAKIKLNSLFLFTIVIALLCISVNGGYLGCYKEIYPIRHFIKNPGAYGKWPLTPQICYTICGKQGHDYAALAMGKFCFCADASPDGPLEKDNAGVKCTLPCPGDGLQTCGSKAYVDVYKTPIPVDLTLNASPKTVASGINVAFTPTVEPIGIGYSLRIDYGDEAGLTAYSENGTDLLSRTYHEAGLHEIRSYVTDVNEMLPDVETATSVVVDSVPEGVTITCPGVMATYEEDTCYINIIRGTNMNVTISYTDGNPGSQIDVSFQIADSSEHSLGNSVQEHIPLPLATYTSGTSTAGLIMHQGSPAQYSGFLVGIEYYGVGTGTLDVYIYRPDCGAGQMYCYDTNACDSTCDVTCGAANLCMDTGSCCGSPIIRTPGLLASYTLIHTVSVSITPGYGYHDALVNLDILPGDVLAHDGKVSPLIANSAPDVPVGTTYDRYCSPHIAPGVIGDSDCTTTTEVHQLKAIYAESTDFMYPIEFTNTGTVTIEATVTNLDPVNIPGSVVSSTSISVLEGVDAALLLVPDYVALNTNTEFSVASYTGSPANVSWTIGSDPFDGVDLQNVQHTITTLGFMNVTVSISNAVSSKSNSTMIKVEDLISGLSLGVPLDASDAYYDYVEVGVEKTINVVMATGSDYVCDIKFTCEAGSTDFLSITDIDGLSFDYTFNIAGNIIIDVNCSNNLGLDEFTQTVRAVERLTDVALTPPGAVKNVAFNFILTWDKGTDVSLNSFEYDSESIDMIVDGSLKQASSVHERQEATIGIHDVSYQLTNPLGTVLEPSATFIIEERLENVDISCIFPSESNVPGSLHTVIPLNTEAHCTVDMSAGTSVVIDLDYGDGDTYQFAAATGMDWAVAQTGISFPITHNYTTEGYHQLMVTVSNSYNSEIETYPVAVMVGVDNTFMKSVIPVRFGPTALIDFTFDITGSVPNDVRCYIIWGDGNDDEYYPCDLTDVFTHEYLDDEGTMTLTYRLENLISSIEHSIPVYTVSPIIDNECFPRVAAGIPGVPLEIVFKTWRAPPPGELDLTFDCDTSDPAVLITRPNQFEGPYAEETESCIYNNTLGEVTVSVRAVSLMDDILTECSFTILHPVTDEFDVFVPDAPIAQEFNNVCLFNYQIIYNGSPYPDEAQIEIDFDDNTTSGLIPFAASIDTDHQYATAGHYVSTVRIFNNASEVTKKILTGCYEAFSSLSIEVKRTPTFPLDSPDVWGFEYVGKNNVFSTDEPIRIYPTLGAGTLVWWEASAVSGDDVYHCNSSDDVITLNIDKPGDYITNVTPRNPVHTGPTAVYESIVMNPVKKITVTDLALTNANEDRHFSVSMEIFGSNMCVAVAFGDTTNIVEVHSNTTYCSDTSPAAAYFPGAIFENVTTDVSQAFDLVHNYTSMGTYTLRVFAWNVISEDTATFQFAVSGIDCTAPNLDIRNQCDDVRCAIPFKRSKRIKITGLLDISCPKTLYNTKNWTITKIDKSTDTVINEVSISDVQSSVNAELAIDPHFLDYGCYYVLYKVTMLIPSDEGEVFSSTAGTYIEVTPGDLVAQLFESSMSMVTVSPKQLLTLSPNKYSYDQDVHEDLREFDTFDSILMACRDITLNETFPLESVEVLPMNKSDMPFGFCGSGGGCFCQGPGWFENFDGSISFWTDILQPEHTYEFKVIVRKAAAGIQREATVTGQVYVATADPPEFQIDYSIPDILKTSAEGKLFNGNNQLGILTTLITPCPACIFLWKMFAYDYKFCGATFNCWRVLSYIDRYIDGAESKELTIRTELFTRYSSTQLFQLRLIITDTSTNINGTGILNLKRNNPPEGGKCTISPDSGTALVTSFNIECLDFTDREDHEIVGYKITCMSEDGLKTVAEDAWPSWSNKMLPVGIHDDNYVLQCEVTVTDELGAAASYPMDNVTVNQMNMTEYKQMLQDMLNTDSDIADMLQAIGNLPDTANYVASLASMMREMSEDDENSVYAGCGTILSFMSTGIGSNTSRTSAFAQEKAEVDPEQMEKFEMERDAPAKLYEQLVDSLFNVTVGNPPETDQLTGLVAEMTRAKAYLTRHSLDSMTELLETSVDTALTHSEAMSVEQTTSIAQHVFDACSNIGEVAGKIGEMPTNTDVETQAEAVKGYDTNLYSPNEAVAMKTNDKDALRDGKKKFNKRVQKDFASGNLKKCTNIQESLIDLLGRKQPKSRTPIRLNTASFSAVIFKNDAKSLENQSVVAGDCTFDVPPELFPDTEKENTFTLSITSQAAPQVPLESRSRVSKTSRTINVNVKDANENKVPVKNLKVPARLKIAQDPETPKIDMSDLPLANPVILETRADEILFYHNIEAFNERAGLKIRFSLTNASSDVQLLVLVNYLNKPEIDASRSKLIYSCMVPRHTSLTGTSWSESEEDPSSCFIDADIISKNTGIYSIGVRQLLQEELNMYNTIDDLPLSVPEKWKRAENKKFTTDYIFNCLEFTCAYYDDGDSVAKTDGVKPSSLSDETAVICLTTHFTTFAGGWAVAPNTIDWNFVFSNADFFKNPTLYITEIVIVIAYIIAMIWARRKDRQDIEKLGLAPLLDNDPRDKYYYEIMVSTGMRRGAGTESKVHFIISGEEEETDVRTFEDKKRKIFTRGSTDGFLMSVPEPIGALNYLRIWHDNSGKGRMASWYLNHVIVRDVQTDKKYYFIANKWFAVEEDDGQVDRVIPVAGKEQMTEFSHLFTERATKNLSDGHLWFSVVARPPQSRFTRCQRVSCCLCLLYSSMLANAMFYGTETSDTNAFQFGPFALSSEQIFIGVMANLIIFPINFLLITLFRKSRPRKLRPSRVEEAIKAKPERTTSMADVNPRVKSSLDYERPGSSFLMDTKRSESSMSRPETSMSATNVDVGYKKKKKCELPWWFTIVSWILLWLAVLVSAAFVTFYGISFQDVKCKKWITSMLISFFMSIFLTQPIKVFLFAIIFSLIIKNPGGDEDDDDDEEAPKKLDTDEEYLHNEEDEFGFVTPRRPMYKPKPPDTKALEAARKQRLKEIQMWAVIREILFYAFFLWILLVISYRNVSTNSYNYKHNMQKVFILTNDTNKAFTKVKNTNDFWVWAKSGMLRGLRAGPYYNDFPPFYMRGYINDKQSRLMGYAILRQTRTQPNTCKIPKYVEGIIDECNGAYDIADEEDQDYGVGWTPLPVNSTREEYKYMSASSLNSFPYWGEMALYGGGGYVVKLNKAYEDMIDQFNQLESEGWIDRYTRAVFLEFTVYNPSINLFSVSTLLAEFVPTGGVFTSFRFEPCNLLPYMNSALLFQIICEIIYFAFTVFFVFKEIRFIIKQKKQYFLQFWNLVDLGICAMSVTAIVIYFYRLFCINELTAYFNETHGNEYMKFQYVGYWSEIFNYIIGFLVFFATLKFMKLLRFNKKISMLSDTLRNSSKDLIHFSIIFNVVFLAFIQVFYLVYMSHLDIFKTFLSSCEAGIVMMMGKFDIYNMLGVNQWLTQIFIFLFVVTVTFIVVNMLLSILNDTFSAVRNDRSKQQNDYEIVDFMLGRFKTWTGIGRDNTTISPSEMEERNKSYRTLEGQIDYFPDQIDRFLASISNMYVGDARFDDFLQKGMAKKMAMKAQAEEPGMSHPPPRFQGALRISSGARGMTDVQTD